MSVDKKSPRGLIVAICALVYFVSYFARKDFAAVMASMLSDGIIDKSIGGFIGMGLFACYGVGQLVSGYLGDKIKPKVLLAAGLAVTALCNLAMPLVPHNALMIPVWALNGFAQAMLWPPIVRILADNLEGEKFVAANLVVTSAAHVSTIILYIFVPVCLSFFAWQTVFFTASALSLVALAVFCASMAFITGGTSRAEKSEKADSESAAFLPLFMKAGMPFVFVAIVMMGFLRDGIETWLPTLYAEAFGRGAEESILVSAVLPVFSILSIVAVTALHKLKLFSLETRGAAILFLAAMLCALPIAIFISFDVAALRLVCLLFAALVCACMHAVNFLYISCLPARFAKHGRAATASGFSNACTYVGAAISTYGIGALSELIGWSLNVVCWMIIAALGAIFSLLAMKKYSVFVTQK